MFLMTVFWHFVHTVNGEKQVEFIGSVCAIFVLGVAMTFVCDADLPWVLTSKLYDLYQTPPTKVSPIPPTSAHYMKTDTLLYYMHRVSTKFPIEHGWWMLAGIIPCIIKVLVTMTLLILLLPVLANFIFPYVFPWWWGCCSKVIIANDYFFFRVSLSNMYVNALSSIQ